MSQKILIVEDDEAVSQAVATALDFEGYITKVVSEAQYALTAVRSFKPNLILLDFLLSGTDGVEISKKIKRNTATKHIPIILMSAHPTAAKIAEKAGVEGFLAKPFDISTLTTKIYSLMPA